MAKELEDNYRNALLPQSLLFSGPRGSSRLTAAMDLSFLLTGEEDVRPVLRSPSVIFLPHREMSSRLNAAIKLFQKDMTDSSRLFLIETLRLVLMQYHPAFSSIVSSSNSDSFSFSSEVDSVVMAFEDSRSYSKKEVGELVEIAERCLNPKFLYQGKKGPTTPSIDQIRAIQEFFSSKGDGKVVVLEDIEDATEGARNSLLKMLEEPEENCHIILLSSNSQKMLQTILSRVRKFQFPALNSKAITELLKKRFNLYENYTSFDSFFFQKGSGEEKRKEMDENILAVTSSILSSRPLLQDREEEILSSLEKLSSWRYFREMVSISIEEGWKKGEIDSLKAKRISNALARWQQNTDIYNMSQRMAFDLMLREALNV